MLIFQDSHKVEILGWKRNPYWKCQHMLILKHNMLLKTLRAVTEITFKLVKLHASNTPMIALLLSVFHSPRVLSISVSFIYKLHGSPCPAHPEQM